MTNLKKCGLVAALVLPTIFTATSKAEASKAVKNSDKAAAVNVRSEAKEADNIIGLIDNDEAYEVVDNQNGWLKIKFGDKEAYVGSYWFNITEEAKVKSPANFRKDDHLDSEIYQVLKKDDVVEVLSYADNGFVKVMFEGKEGYVHDTLLDLPESFVNANKAQPAEVSNNSNYAQQTSYQAPAQNYQASNETYYEAPAQTTYQAPAQSYQGSSSSAKEIIAQRESGGSYTARNGQYIGRYQLSSSYLNGDYSAANQERVADQYVAQRYGSWDNALAFWNNNGWY